MPSRGVDGIRGSVSGENVGRILGRRLLSRESVKAGICFAASCVSRRGG